MDMLEILNNKNLTSLKPGVQGLNYDRDAVSVGIVHMGPGAFHRAHQAVYTDDLLRKGYRQWGICEVSIHSSGVRDELNPQDNLYNLLILDREVSHRVIGAVKEILVAPENPQAVLDRLSQETTKVVSLTVTEKGYCLNAQGKLDLDHPAIDHDLKNPQTPRSVIGFLVAGLNERRRRGVAPFVPLSCDNLTDNGKRLGAALLEFSRALQSQYGSAQSEYGGLAEWIEAEVQFPCTMVDSITPATTDEVRQRVAEATGLRDQWPIQRESFTQWVIEDLPGVELPPWDEVGATLSRDVHGYEATKLRILNGLHSSLAFIGILAGFETVEAAINEPVISEFLAEMLEDEIVPTLPSVEGLDQADYGRSILSRFKNPAIRHLLSQIAWDSSQKVPFRILGTIEDNLSAGKTVPKLCFAVAAWMHFVRKKEALGSPITDPLADTLCAVARDCSGDGKDVERFLELEQMFPEALSANKDFRENVIKAYRLLEENPGASSVLLALKQVI